MFNLIPVPFINKENVIKMLDYKKYINKIIISICIHTNNVEYKLEKTTSMLKNYFVNKL